MPSKLDNQINAIVDHLIKPGEMFELEYIERFGQQLPAFKNAPPSLTAYFAHFCNQNKDKDFLVEGDVRLTFGQTYAAADRLARALVADHGVKKGDRVGIAARNSINWIIAYMAVLMAGGCATLLNGWWSGEELAEGIDLAECELVLADAQRAARLEGFDAAGKVKLFGHGTFESGFADLLANGGQGELPALGPDDLATILYTSGSTGRSKGAYSDHRGVVQGIFSYVSVSATALHIYVSENGSEPPNQPCALVAVPLFHVTGEVPLFLQSFALGRKLVLIPKWDAVEAMRAMEQEKVSYFVGVPLMSYEIATHPDRDKYDLSSCTAFAAGGSPRPVEHVGRIRDAFPDSFPLLGYGLTETNAVGAGNFNENYLAKPNSTGMATRPIVDIAILDDAGNPVAQGERGEISIRTIANFIGYWGNPEATRQAIMPDGYFRTGDLGYLDEDGYLFIVDRKKDIIIRGGENIACIEVEEAIYAHPQVSECSVFGVPDDRFGEIPAAVWLPVEGADLTEDDLREFLGEHLAPFKIPAVMWKATEKLPRLGTEKVDKVSLRKTYTARLETA
ncbi:class I adenylate-forming enzyme family protein [Altererythrobacter sp. CAU 1778]